MNYVCVFDVDETLLDLSAIDPGFQDVFGDASVRQAWFQLDPAWSSTRWRRSRTSSRLTSRKWPTLC
jgi:FMN phosphatase YigB (HAD superfamily)